MKQATHAWIAIRAAALIGDDPETAGLFGILRPHIRNAALGAWMPDLADTKLGSGDIDNHVFKMAPFKLSADSRQLSARYVTPKDDLLAALGPGRAVTAFLKDDATLGCRDLPGELCGQFDRRESEGVQVRRRRLASLPLARGYQIRSVGMGAV